MASSSNIQIANLKPFDGTGFSNWEFRLKLVLEQNNVIEVIEENVSESRAAEQEFKTKDVKARSIIVQWLTDNVLETVKEKKTAREMYMSLYNTYMRKGLSTRVDLQKKLRSMKFEKGQLSDFISEFEKTVTELRASGGTIPEEEVISQLLASMPETYQSITTTIDVIFAQNPKDINYQFVKNRLLQEEIRQNGEAKDNSQSVAFTSRYGRGRFNKRNKFSNAKNKYTNEGSSSSGSSSNHFPFNCYNCGKQGHKRNECPERRAHVAAKEEEEEIVFIAKEKEEEEEEQEMTFVTKEQKEIVFIIGYIQAVSAAKFRQASCCGRC